MSKYDLAIVGLGVAGIQLSYLAQKMGKRVIHFHKSMAGESTPVAAGLINPITGRRFVKSWRIDDIMPYSEVFYKEMEEELDIRFLKRMSIIRTFRSPEDENNWISKTADPFLAKYLKVNPDFEDHRDRFFLPELYGELENCLKLDTAHLQNSYLEIVKDQHLWIDEYFEHDRMHIEQDKITYDTFEFEHIVFAEGFKVLENPLFINKHFAPSKGEHFIINAPELKSDKAYKHEMFVTPLGDDKYWVGATYAWKDYNPIPTKKMYEKLYNQMERVILTDYEMTEYRTGIRPSSIDRRPIIGTHPSYNNVHLFNGLGTKGTSLGPYFAKMLLENIWLDRLIDEDVNYSRFFK